MAPQFIVSFALLVVAICAMVQFASGQDQAMPNFKDESPSPMIPTQSDKDKCEQKAKEDGQKLVETKKIRRETCKPQCVYENGETSRVVSADDQLCCDIVGVMATGKCKNGECKPFWKSFGRK